MDGYRTRALVALLTAVVCWPLLSCDRDGTTSTARSNAAPWDRQPVGESDILATVNGVPISEWDVRYKLRNDSHTAEMTEQYRKSAVETLIREELFRQRAMDLGLEGDTRYKKGIRQLEAQVNAFERKEFTRLLLQRITESEVSVNDEDARKYFAENLSRIRTELHVWQILKKGEKVEIERALEDIRNGTPFEEVAERQFPGLPKTVRRPWDLGYLRWQQVPAVWRDVVYNLDEGAVSGIIPGPRDRFWIIKLVDTRENQDVTFESVRPTIMGFLRSEALETIHKTIERDLRGKARIVYRERSPARFQK